MICTYSKSLYSKQIGWSKESIPLPTMSKLEQIISEAKKGNEKAAIMIFRLFRNAKSPVSESDINIMYAIVKAFHELFI